MTRVDIRTERREQALDITGDVSSAVMAAGVNEGVAHVYCPHTTAGIAVNEHADPDVMSDVFDWLARTVPERGGWQHAEGNADAHVKAVLVGSSVSVPVSDGHLALGTWQGVFFCEFDGPRSRHFLVSVLEAR